MKLLTSIELAEHLLPLADFHAEPIKAHCDALAARVALYEKAIGPYLGNPHCAHNQVINVCGGRRDHGIPPSKSCGMCGADLILLEALGRYPLADGERDGT